MTRHQTIDQKSKLDQLTDDQLAALADMTSALMQTMAPPDLSNGDKAQIDAALGRLAAGQGVAWDDVKSRLDARLKAAGA